MPAKILAFFTSSSAVEKLSKDRTTPGITSDVTRKRVLSPKCCASTPAAAPLTHEWPEGYSGCAGVANNGNQVGSAVVAGLPSVSGRGIAVIGRQKTYVYFASQHPMAASAMAKFNSANNRALFSVELWC